MKDGRVISGGYRDSEYGILRIIGKGLKTSVHWTESEVHLKDGTVVKRGERITEDGQVRDVIVGHYDDSKYKLT